MRPAGGLVTGKENEMVRESKHKLDGDTATLDLKTLVSHALDGVVTAKILVERRMEELYHVRDRFNLNDADQERSYVFYCSCAANDLAEAAQLLANAYENYHYLHAAQSRDEIVISK